VEYGPHLLLKAGLLVLSLGLFPACRAASPLSDTAAESVEGGLTTRRWRAQTDQHGVYEIPVPVHSNQSAMLICGVTDRPHAWLSLESVSDPAGEVVLAWDDWYDRPERITGAIFPIAADSCVNWPIRSTDGPLWAGTWTVSLAATHTSGRYWEGVALDVITQVRVDPADDGTLMVTIGLAGDLDQDVDLAVALEGAVARWAEIWAAVGVSLSVTIQAIDLPLDIPDPVGGSELLFAAAETTVDSDVLVVIGETIDGDGTLYGVSGAVPGPLAASPRAVVAISWLVNAGQDAAFDEGEVRLFGETLAHEAGHYAGLLHPVEEGWDRWDALDDTPPCSSRGSCEAALGDNVMFPYPLCNYVSCEAQVVVTDEQSGVLGHYTGVH
jgi:hypothetical protein